MYGGVDLSALKAQKEAEQNPAPAGGIVRNVTKDSIEDLLQQTTQVPFVLVFHSDRSEGSVKLVDQLTSTITSKGGSLGLGIVNVDADMEIAGAFRVQAVPTTVAVIGGNPVPLFQGVPSPEDMTKALDQVLAAASQMGVTGTLQGAEGGEAPEPKLPPHVAEARAALAAGNLEEAENEYSAALKENPGDSNSQAGLLQVQLLRRVESIDPATVNPMGTIDEQLDVADLEVADGMPEEAFNRLLGLIKNSSGDDRERIRVRFVELMTVVGQKDPAVQNARRNLASALM